MLHTVYKTINLLNDKFYIGVHSCKCKNCQYLGSGKALRAAIRKYGKENFKSTILKTFKTKEDAYSYEAKLVTKKEVLNPQCYNLTVGGKGQKNPVSICEKSCIIEGVEYSSRTEAARALDVHPSTITKWLKGINTPRAITYNGKTYSSYADLQEKTGLNPQAAYRLLSGKTKTGLVKSNTQWYVKGLVFDTQLLASRHFGVTRKCISKWCRTLDNCYPIEKHHQ